MSKAAHAIDRILTWARNPWALTPDMLHTVCEILDRRLHAGPHALDASQLAALTGRPADDPAPEVLTSGGIAIIPLHGVIAPRINLVSDISGGTTFEATERALAMALADPGVRAIVFDVDSPGGSVFGAHEFARSMLAARAEKPIIAHVQYLGASAAYWAASMATQVVVSPSAQVGSIGVLGVHEDRSALLEKEGIKRTILSAGEGKTDANPDEPLSSRARAQLQKHVDHYYALFVTDVANGRGTSGDVIRGSWQARVYTADEALDLGLVDRVETLDATLARLGVTDAPPLEPHPDLTPGLARRDTPQEPRRVTGQDRAAQLALERSLLELVL